MSDLARGGCGVCLSGYDCDELDIDTYYERIVTANRAYRCFDCDATIHVGEKHEQCGGQYDGAYKNWRFCLICSEISHAFYCDGRSFGTLWEDIEEHLFPELTTGCLAKLKTAAAKSHLLNEWRKWKFTNQPA